MLIINIVFSTEEATSWCSLQNCLQWFDNIQEFEFARADAEVRLGSPTVQVL